MFNPEYTTAKQIGQELGIGFVTPSMLKVAARKLEAQYDITTPVDELARRTRDISHTHRLHPLVSVTMKKPDYWLEGMALLDVRFKFGNEEPFRVIEFGVTAVSESELLVLCVQRHRLGSTQRKNMKGLPEYVAGDNFYTHVKDMYDIPATAYALAHLPTLVGPGFTTFTFPTRQAQYIETLEAIQTIYNMPSNQMKLREGRLGELLWKADTILERGHFPQLLLYLGIKVMPAQQQKLFSVSREELVAASQWFPML